MTILTDLATAQATLDTAASKLHEIDSDVDGVVQVTGGMIWTIGMLRDEIIKSRDAGPTGPDGPAGPDGPEGVAGTTGTAGATGVITSIHDATAVNSVAMLHRSNAVFAGTTYATGFSFAASNGTPAVGAPASGTWRALGTFNPSGATAFVRIA